MAQSTTPATVLGGRYVLEERLGRSRTGMAWRSHDALLRRTVVVQLVHPRLADDPSFVDALDEQARRVAGLSVPGVARLLDTGRDDGLPLLIREHAPGAGVRTRLERGPMPSEEAVRVALAVLRALGELHDQGVLHLALDADDVIVDDEGRVSLTGLVLGAALTSAGADVAQLLGPERVAPEQRVAATPDERIDVFLSGALLFEMLTGEPPGERRSPRRLRPDVPRAVDRIVARALDPDPGRRYPSTRAFADALEHASEDRIVEVPDASHGASLFAWVGVPLLIAGVASALIALGLWFGQLEVGGPLGVRPAREPAAGAPASPVTVTPTSVVAVDPFGDGEELSSNAPLAADGDTSSAWRSENYFDGELGKPGIGLLLDLGGRTRVLGLELWTPNPGFTFGVAIGDDPAGLVGDVQEVTASPVTHVVVEGTGRYVLVWITSVVPVDDGNRAEVAELRVVVDERRASGA